MQTWNFEEDLRTLVHAATCNIFINITKHVKKFIVLIRVPLLSLIYSLLQEVKLKHIEPYQAKHRVRQKS